MVYDTLFFANILIVKTEMFFGGTTTMKWRKYRFIIFKNSDDVIRFWANSDCFVGIQKFVKSHCIFLFRMCYRRDSETILAKIIITVNHYTLTVFPVVIKSSNMVMRHAWEQSAVVRGAQQTFIYFISLAVLRM